MEFKLFKTEKTNKELLEKVTGKLNKIPELEDVLNQICKLEIDSTKQIRIEITTKDFDKGTNTSYEKIIKRQ